MRITAAILSLAVQVLADVKWESPAAGDVYVPGDTLQATWTSPSKVISPSFTICTVDNSTSASDDADCGTAVWPSINQNGTEYSISLAVPNITGNGDYYLLMKDDAGKAYDTPNFSLALSKVNNSTANATATPTPNSSTAQPTSTSITYLPSHSAPTAVAIAVPLALVAATLLGALLLLLCRTHRSRRREKDKLKELRDAEKLRSRESIMSFASATDIERAVWTLAAARGYGGPGSYGQPPQPPPHMGGPFGAQGLSATAAAALGMGAFGWAHPGFGQGPPAAPVNHDVFTPAPVRSSGSSSFASARNQPQATHAAAGHGYSAPPSQGDPRPLSEHMHPRQETGRRPVNWDETDWRGTDRMFADDAARSGSQSSGPPQLPAIQLHSSSPPPRVQHTPPPPLPPKELFPGYAPRPYNPPYASAPDPHPHLGHTPGTNVHASLNVISDYLHPSPALPQGQHLAPPPDAYGIDMPTPLRVPPPSLTRTRSLRRLETVLEDEKPLPIRPEDRVGTDLYGAVSRAVGG